jgi:hypothetical protein
MNALLLDARAHKKTKMTPRTETAVFERAEQGDNAGAILAALRDVYKQRGEHDRELPTPRSIQKLLHTALKYVTNRRVFLIKTPWHARQVLASCPCVASFGDIHCRICCWFRQRK